MQGFKVIIKLQAEGLNKANLELALKELIANSSAKILIQNIKAKGTSVMGIADPMNILESTISRRNAEVHRQTKLADTLGEQVTDLTAQVENLLEIIRAKERLLDSSEDCSCNDWRSIGTDPETGDKLKRCNICNRLGIR